MSHHPEQSEQLRRSMADAKEFRATQGVKGTRAFLCMPQPCAPPPHPPPCKPPCSPCVGQIK
ncbi:MAG: hypothetical protein PHE48_00605 [Candidatus Daviesbacteria bacterium]|nr:hypothetical protein [Candidatus Daviesbacteria bacterium]